MAVLKSKQTRVVGMAVLKSKQTRVVGMAVLKSKQTRVVGIISTYMVHPYACFLISIYVPISHILYPHACEVKLVSEKYHFSKSKRRDVPCMC